MTTSIDDVRQALAAAVAAGTGLRCQPYIRAKINAPEAQVGKAPMSPDMVFNNAKSAYQFRVVIYVAGTDDSTQRMLDEFCAVLGDQSIRAAVADGTNWPDSLVDYAKVVAIGEPTLVERGETQYLTVQLDVEVVW